MSLVLVFILEVKDCVCKRPKVENVARHLSHLLTIGKGFEMTMPTTTAITTTTCNKKNIYGLQPRHACDGAVVL